MVVIVEAVHMIYSPQLMTVSDFGPTETNTFEPVSRPRKLVLFKHINAVSI